MDQQTGPSGTMYAWIDESIAIEAGTYVLASAVAQADSCETIRTTLTGLRPRGRTRLHWRDESVALRRKIAAAIAGCELSSLVVVATPVDPKRQERARRMCAERLFYELDRLGVAQAWMEARTPTLNKMDLDLIAALRGSQAMSASLRVDFGYPSTEPMLWAADAVAGMVTAAHKQIDEYRQAIGPLLTEIAIDL